MRLLLFIIVALPTLVWGQFGGTDNPPSIKWKEISNESARIVFPAGLEKRAYRVADVIDYLNKNARSSIGPSKGKINIILQNQLTEANGFVTLAPFHSEFFTTSPQHSFEGTTDWLDLLAIHEYRHVMQFQFSKQGIPKLFARFFGEIGWGGATLLSVPLWFAEGDATMQETLLSEGGRGRSGSFLAEYRAMHQAGIRHPYEVIRNRSFKYILPNRYKMGYLFSYYGRQWYGDTLWREVVRDAVHYKGLVWPFSQGLKKRTGMSVHHFYNAMIDSLYAEWDNADSGIKPRESSARVMTPAIRPGSVTYYNYPRFYKGRLVVLHSGGDRPPMYEMIKGRRLQKKLFDLGYHPGYFNIAHHSMVWTQNEPDARWSKRMYSVVYVYDFKTRKKRRLTRRTKYFSPDIRPDGKQVVVVNSDDQMLYDIRVLDAATGQVLSKVPNPKNYFLSTPRWKNNSQLIAVAQYHQRNALVEVDLPTGKIRPLMEFTHNLVSGPVVRGNYVYFSGDFTDIRNIFALDLRDRKLYQITFSKVLAQQPDVSGDGRFLVYSEQQINGADIKKVLLAPENWKPVHITEPFQRHKELLTQVVAENGPVLDKIPQQEYDVMPYRWFRDAIHVHSWYPALDIINDGIGLGYGVLSTNLLSTLQTSANATINYRGESKLSASATWTKYYPQLSLNYDISRINIKDGQTLSKLVGHYTYAGIKIPLNFSRGVWSRSLVLGVSEGYRTFKLLNADGDRPSSEQLFEANVSFSNKKSQGRQQLGPGFGQTIQVDFKSCCGFSDVKGTFPVSVEGELFFPGIKRTHSLKLSGHYHTRRIYGYEGNGLRGLIVHSPGTTRRVSLDYAWPIAYPDIVLGPFMYIARLRGNLFFDQALDGVGENSVFGGQSMGIELRTDVGLFNFGSLFLAPIGVRISYVRDGVSPPFNFQIIFD